MPGALAFATVNVMGPAATELLSSLQPSLPPSLASVTFTVFTPAVLVGAALDELPAVSLLEPHAVTVIAAAASSAGAASQNLGDTEPVLLGLIPLGFLSIV